MLWRLAVLRMSSDLPSPPLDPWRFFDTYELWATMAKWFGREND